ncbi:MAG: cell envelope protein SmpA [Citromicrobium sp.]|nr:MAG: cell envelope protein SmpA [Citromicrobium sp.]
MKTLTAIALLAGAAFMAPAYGQHSASTEAGGVVVDADAFTENNRTLRKKGVTVGSAQLMPIRPGVDKDTIYNLIGPPHFNEGITRRWNFVIFIAGEAPEPLRCRLRIDFGDPRDGYNVVVRQMTWSSEECLAAANA